MAECFSFENKPHVAVAVSGGADSMALMLLAAEWAKERGGFITALTVDHGLRPESKNEALQIAEWCGNLGIEHHTLNWIQDSGFRIRGVQETARNARYQLLANWCREHSAPYLLTAHHRDDQAETLFFRLARGSGLDGLACMQSVVKLEHDIQLLRPFLPIPKSRLIATLQAQNQSWIEDPSNRNPNYTRNRIRAAMEATGNRESISERTYLVTKAFSEFRNILENNTASKLTLCTSIQADGSIIINSNAFLELEPEYGLRIIASIVKKIGKGEHNPRTEKMERFYKVLCEDIITKSRKKRSFAHCIFQISPKKEGIIVSEEIRRS